MSKDRDTTSGTMYDDFQCKRADEAALQSIVLIVALALFRAAAFSVFDIPKSFFDVKLV